jgi:hypothetical protein
VDIRNYILNEGIYDKLVSKVAGTKHFKKVGKKAGDKVKDITQKAGEAARRKGIKQKKATWDATRKAGKDHVKMMSGGSNPITGSTVGANGNIQAKWTKGKGHTMSGSKTKYAPTKKEIVQSSNKAGADASTEASRKAADKAIKIGGAVAGTGVLAGGAALALKKRKKKSIPEGYYDKLVSKLSKTKTFKKVGDKARNKSYSKRMAAREPELNKYATTQYYDKPGLWKSPLKGGKSTQFPTRKAERIAAKKDGNAAARKAADRVIKGGIAATGVAAVGAGVALKRKKNKGK